MDNSSDKTPSKINVNINTKENHGQTSGFKAEEMVFHGDVKIYNQSSSVSESSASKPETFKPSSWIYSFVIALVLLMVSQIYWTKGISQLQSLTLLVATLVLLINSLLSPKLSESKENWFLIIIRRALSKTAYARLLSFVSLVISCHL